MSEERLDPRLEGLLVCPQCRGELDEERGWLVCRSQQTRWPIVGGVPFLAPEYAEHLPATEA